MISLSKNAFLLLSLLAAGLTTVSALAESKAEWKAAMYGRSTDDSFSSSRTVGFAGLIHAKHEFNEILEAKFLGGAALETGSSSALFTNEFEPRSRLFLQEASLRLKPFSGFSTLLGALEQTHHGSPLLIDGGTFPAALLAFDLPKSSWILHLDGQAAIPTSQSLSTRATGKEKTPLLFTQKLVAGYENTESGFKALARASHFEFRDLTRGIAQDSRFYGNSITGVASASRFVYQYQGFEVGPDLVVPFGERFLFGLGASFLQNTQGPRRADQGAYAYADLTYKAESFSLKPKFEWYRNEADSAPAFYSSSKFGHNNRKGTGLGLLLALPKAGFEVELNMKRSRLIEPRTFQKDKFDYLELSVEIPYAGF